MVEVLIAVFFVVVYGVVVKAILLGFPPPRWRLGHCCLRERPSTHATR